LEKFGHFRRHVEHNRSHRREINRKQMKIYDKMLKHLKEQER
jgi:hypothetical protein